MRSWIKALEETFTAVAFAEAGQHDTARALAPASSLWPRLTSWATRLSDSFAAVAFAEAGDHDSARRIAPASDLAARLTARAEQLQETFAAVAFAEAGAAELYPAMARPTRAPAPTTAGSLKDFMADVGLAGIPAYYGVARL